MIGSGDATGKRAKPLRQKAAAIEWLDRADSGARSAGGDRTDAG
jgi:hypothetical protein